MSQVNCCEAHPVLDDVLSQLALPQFLALPAVTLRKELQSVFGLISRVPGHCYRLEGYHLRTMSYLWLTALTPHHTVRNKGPGPLRIYYADRPDVPVRE